MIIAVNRSDLIQQFLDRVQPLQVTGVEVGGNDVAAVDPVNNLIALRCISKDPDCRIAGRRLTQTTWVLSSHLNCPATGCACVMTASSVAVLKHPNLVPLNVQGT